MQLTKWSYIAMNFNCKFHLNDFTLAKIKNALLMLRLKFRDSPHPISKQTTYMIALLIATAPDLLV